MYPYESHFAIVNTPTIPNNPTIITHFFISPLLFNDENNVVCDFGLLLTHRQNHLYCTQQWVNQSLMVAATGPHSTLLHNFITVNLNQFIYHNLTILFHLLSSIYFLFHLVLLLTCHDSFLIIPLIFVPLMSFVAYIVIFIYHYHHLDILYDVMVDWCCY